jgi:hypothetical protein
LVSKSALAGGPAGDYDEINAGRHVPAAAQPCLATGASDMNQNPPASPTSSADTAAQPVRHPLDPRALAAALAGIRADSQREAETYLRDTVVPHGGE